MKALLPCVLLVSFAAGAADAAVTFNFTGTSSYGAYLRYHADGQPDVVTDGDPAAAVSGSFTIDTAALGANLAAAPAVSYAPGNTPFITASFSGPAIGGVGPLVYSTRVATHYVEADGGDYAVISYSWEDLDENTGNFVRTTYELTGYGVTTSVLGGVLLPDFTTATEVSYALTSQFGSNQSYHEYFSSGLVDTVDVAAPAAVPEPATWGMMVLGFGLAGAAVRRRRTAVIA